MKSSADLLRYLREAVLQFSSNGGKEADPLYSCNTCHQMQAAPGKDELGASNSSSQRAVPTMAQTTGNQQATVVAEKWKECRRIILSTGFSPPFRT